MAAMQAVTISDAATLRFGTRSDGARAYLAVHGGIDRPLVLGSRSTTIGTCGGRPLRAGDRLMIGAATARPLPGRVDAACRDRHEADLVRVLRGPDVPEGGAAVLDALCATVYTVSSQSNRMAYRLQGAPVDLPAPRRLSSGTVWGALQIPPDGQPLLLLADRQTTGGYPIAAVVISADASRVAQLAPGDRCRFTLCSRREALAALLAMEQDILRLG
jgi:biotin-dependent carboxylase-like uncharacterized protein